MPSLFFVNLSPKFDSEFKNFVNLTQSESGWAIQKKKFFIFLAFFACILDSNVLKDAHVVTAKMAESLAVTVIEHNVAPLKFYVSQRFNLRRLSSYYVNLCRLVIGKK